VISTAREAMKAYHAITISPDAVAHAIAYAISLNRHPQAKSYRDSAYQEQRDSRFPPATPA